MEKSSVPYLNLWDNIRIGLTRFISLWIIYSLFHVQEIAQYLRPETIRAKFGVNLIKNAIHCTDLPDDVPIEVISFLFERVTFFKFFIHASFDIAGRLLLQDNEDMMIEACARYGKSANCKPLFLYCVQFCMFGDLKLSMGVSSTQIVQKYTIWNVRSGCFFIASFFSGNVLKRTRQWIAKAKERSLFPENSGTRIMLLACFNQLVVWNFICNLGQFAL